MSRSYLIDTHILLWSLFDPNKLSKKVRDIVEHEDNEVLVSTVSFWEISLKYRLKKLELKKYAPEDLVTTVKEININILDLDVNDASTYYKLPINNHKDAFDRMLIWQAIQKNLTLLSKDNAFKNYQDLGLDLIW
jgi:PIN domain nuclease of toxin-antitoxin system